MPRISLTSEKVNSIKLVTAGQVFYRDIKLEGFGLRVGKTRKSYFVEKRVDGRTVRHTLGTHGQITADQARKLAGARLGEMTVGADLNAQKRARSVARVGAKAAIKEAAQYTLGSLCDWYVTHQKGLGKQSAGDAAGLFTKYVATTSFAGLPARELSPKQATSMIRLVVEQGHKRTAAKLRAYLRAAYALAQGADTNPQAPAELILFGVEVNPIASTAAIKNASGARDVTLTEQELGEVLRLMRSSRRARHDDALAAIELSLILGGQRLAQVLRLTTLDLDMTAKTITLLDPKGRREVPRKHVLPLTQPAILLLQEIEKVRRAPWLFGDSTAQTTPDTVARKGVELLALAQANLAKKAGGSATVRPKIEARDLRRTAETMLAGMGVSKDVRAQLLSHGLGGVQGRHYDQHAYMAEKANALEAWAQRLEVLVKKKR
jgi:integrase